MVKALDVDIGCTILCELRSCRLGRTSTQQVWCQSSQHAIAHVDFLGVARAREYIWPCVCGHVRAIYAPCLARPSLSEGRLTGARPSIYSVYGQSGNIHCMSYQPTEKSTRTWVSAAASQPSSATLLHLTMAATNASIRIVDSHALVYFEKALGAPPRDYGADPWKETLLYIVTPKSNLIMYV